MQVTLHSTSTILTLNTPDGSVPVRLWEGETESGIAIHVYVARVFSNALDDAPRVEAESQTHPDPSDLVLALVTEREAGPPT